ncbi:endonuclease/exonuclease/phosphatase family protein [Rubinisphaera italica]|uniref:Endonuclease/Exonuclease/phosphatase family protein n=1 Tax=Rubinisphaera italica TaxID=2527969 RepID=A0A5C5XDY3_9PLAN|nr:endonuclease/exonuclease/phosphatase family protein [Rubinisphaera italica]TWT60859.1 Endonuclease/Exonuclease/phosphatase family protein [Rubinisphaera italica]
MSIPISVRILSTWVCSTVLFGSMILSKPLLTDAKDVRVMSFNIRYGSARDGENHWEKRKENVIKTIAAFNPDLLGTQETLGFQKQYLDENLIGYTSLGVGREDGGQTGEMTALFYKTDRFEKLSEGHFWLSESPNSPGSKSWDSSLPRMCSWIKLRDRKADDQPIFFLNTHFDHRGPQARIESAKLIRHKLDELARGCRLIVTGDFNAAFQSEPYKALFENTKELTLLDSYHTATPDNAPGEATFSGFKSGVVEGARIDWIAVSDDWKILSANIDRTEFDGRTPSDHHPVTAILTHE